MNLTTIRWKNDHERAICNPSVHNDLWQRYKHENVIKNAHGKNQRVPGGMLFRWDWNARYLQSQHRFYPKSSCVLDFETEVQLGPNLDHNFIGQTEHLFENVLICILTCNPPNQNSMFLEQKFASPASNMSTQRMAHKMYISRMAYNLILEKKFDKMEHTKSDPWHVVCHGWIQGMWGQKVGRGQRSPVHPYHRMIRSIEVGCSCVIIVH